MAGLADVLKGVLSNLSSPVLNEFWLLWGFGEDKDKLQGNLSAINSVLQDAERRQVNDMAIKDWLRKIKAAAHDAEDVLDEFKIEALQRKVENQEADCCGIPLEKVSNLINLPVFHIKMAHKMQKLRKNFEHIATERSHFQFMAGVVDSQPRISRKETGSKIASEVYGRNTEKANLIDLLIKSESKNEENLSVIPIVGMGGLGKTTLAQLVYNDKKVVTHFKLRMWVYVSDQDFIVKGLLAKILKSANGGTAVDQLSMDQLQTRLEKEVDQLSMDQLQTRLEKELSGKRYLLVLDDVWNEDYFKWDELKTALKCGVIGSKILVTTRSDKVAEIMDAIPRPPLGTLSPVESWALFEKVAHPPTGFISIGEEIVKKCGGVPLAIETLGGMLRYASERKWQSVRGSELWKRTDNEERVLSILRLSYDHLTSSLKQCFVYCAVIPKGRRFNKDKLIKQWIAQGFIHSDDGNELLEEEGEEYFNALLRRSLFQVDEKTASNDEYKMHDLIHDLLKSVAGKECLVVEASTMNDLTRHLALFNDETRHLALCNDDWAGELKNLDALKKCKKLRSMISWVYRCPIDINVCLSFRCLRVLDISRRRSIYFLPNSIDKLRHLRYFDISYTDIKELPETICNLHSLQTLRVLGIHLQKWPKNMKRMISLRHIEFDGGDDFPLPKGIGELTFLRTLPKSKFIIAKESGDRIEELKDLNLLWGNIHIGGLDNIGSVGCAGEADLKDLLKAKKHVNSLTLSWRFDETVTAEGNAEAVIEVLEPHSDLKELSVWSYKGLGFPSWMMKKLTNLKKITLWSCTCVQLPPLGQLVFLESLEIEAMNAVKYIVEFDGSHNYESLFPSLKDLDLRLMHNLEGWSSPREDGDGVEQVRERCNQVIFKCLRTLNIDGCPNLTRPPRLPLLPRLESLDIRGMSWDIMEIPTSQSLMKVELDEMPNLERWSPHEADDGTPVIFYSVRTLSISNCPNLICLPMFLLPALEKLEMRGVGCERIELLRIQNSHQNQISLPGDGIVLTCLKSLIIVSCGNLESISADMLQNLTLLKIEGCPKLWSSLVSLENLKSIERLKISGCPDMPRLLGSMENFTSLTWLSIAGCPGMWSLPESVKNLKSLIQLWIRDCPGISSLPESMGDLTLLARLLIGRCPGITTLPNGLKRLGNLNYLKIYECPGLKGQEWHKAAHVRYIRIDSVDPRQKERSRDRFIYRRR